jgi:hypothetical protein
MSAPLDCSCVDRGRNEYEADMPNPFCLKCDGSGVMPKTVEAPEPKRDYFRAVFQPWKTVVPTEQQLFEIGILTLCEELHMAARGSADPIPPPVQWVIVLYLNKRLAEWKDSADTYDAIVRTLIVETLRQVEANS